MKDDQTRSYRKRYETHTDKPGTYDPNNLLSSLIKTLNLKNDAALSRTLEVAPPVISKIRHGRLPVGASLLIRMQEVSNMSIQQQTIQTRAGKRHHASLSDGTKKHTSPLRRPAR